jgi:two-component system CheB/CheR fusion protein
LQPENDPIAGHGITKGAKGLGLGLGLSQRITGAYGGRIEAESAGEGRGASFKVIIPPLGAGE